VNQPPLRGARPEAGCSASFPHPVTPWRRPLGRRAHATARPPGRQGPGFQTSAAQRRLAVVAHRYLAPRHRPACLPPASAGGWHAHQSPEPASAGLLDQGLQPGCLKAGSRSPAKAGSWIRQTPVPPAEAGGKRDNTETRHRVALWCYWQAPLSGSR
jgi:hypothetical protein